jgi:hypothetical protein
MQADKLQNAEGLKQTAASRLMADADFVHS